MAITAFCLSIVLVHDLETFNGSLVVFLYWLEPVKVLLGIQQNSLGGDQFKKAYPVDVDLTKTELCDIVGLESLDRLRVKNVGIGKVLLLAVGDVGKNVIEL